MRLYLNYDVNLKITQRDCGYKIFSINIENNDLVLTAVLSFDGRVPAAKRLLKINGNGAKSVIVCVYGNRAYLII